MSSPSRPAAASGSTPPPLADTRGNRLRARITGWRERASTFGSLVQQYDQRTNLWLKVAWIGLAVAFVIDVALVGQHALVRYQSYHADAFDLGNMDQAAWNTLHGNPFRFTNRGLDWQGPPTRLGQHVEPIFLLIALLYLIHSGPETLLVFQTVALALGALPLFLLARRLIPALPLLALGFVLAYYWTPSVLGEALWDFHAVSLTTPLLLTALWALAARRYPWFAVAATFAALTKEDVALSLVPLGLLIWFVHGRPRFGQIVIVLSVVWTAFCFFVVLPHFSGGASGGNNFWYRYAWLGSSAGDAAKNLLTHPWLPIQLIVTSPARLGYLAKMLAVGGGLSIFAPYLWLAALPELAVNVFSSHAEQYSGFYQYNAMTVAYFSAGAVYGAARLYNTRSHAASPTEDATTKSASSAPPTTNGLTSRIASLYSRGSRWADRQVTRLPLSTAIAPWFVALLLLLTTVASVQSANPRLTSFWNVGGGPIRGQSAIDALLARVPTNALVAATDTLDPHLSDRYTIYLMPDPRSYSAEYVAVDVVDAAVENRTADGSMFTRMLTSGRYTIVGSVENVTLLKRTGPPLSPDGLQSIQTP